MKEERNYSPVHRINVVMRPAFMYAFCVYVFMCMHAKQFVCSPTVLLHNLGVYTLSEFQGED